MALKLALTLLALRAAHCALPTPLASSEPSLSAPQVLDSLKFLDVPATGRKLDAFGYGDDSEPIALLIGKDVKRLMRRKGLSNGKRKVYRRRKQHKDLESHYHGSHEWARQDSELDHVLDPVSLEDPKDVELRKAIAQLLKEVADRAEKRKKEQHLDSNEMKETMNEENINESDGNVSEKDLNISTVRHDDLNASHDDLSDDGVDENHDEVHGVIDAIEDFDDTEYRSGSIDLDGDSNLNHDHFVSSESDYNYHEDRVSQKLKNVPMKKESLIHDEKYPNEQHNIDNVLKAKQNHPNSSQISKELIKEENYYKHVKENVNNLDNLDNIMLEKSIDGISEDKLKHDSDNELENKNQNQNIYKDHDHENYHHDNQQNTDGNIYLYEGNILKNEVQDKSQNLQNQDNDMKRTEQKDNEEYKELLNVNPDVNIVDEKYNKKENNYHESDQIQEHEDHHNLQDSLLENYDVLSHGDGDEKQQSKDREAQILVNQSSKIDIDVTNKHHSDGVSSKPETGNDNRQNDLDSKEETNPINDAVKETHKYDSVEIPRYHYLPQRKYRSREHDKIRKSYRLPSRNRAPIKHYTLSFFLRK